MSILRLVFYVFVLISLCGCNQQPAVRTTTSMRSTATTETTSVATHLPTELPLILPEGLSIETHLLEAKPEAEPSLIFVPVQGTQEEILARHSQERLLNVIPFIHIEEDANPGQQAYTLSDGTLTAIQFSYDATETTSARRVVQVLQDEQVICTIQAGDVSPNHSFQGLWKYDEHWVLEIAHVTIHRSPDSNKVWSDTKGQIVQDGELLNELYEYEEAFGFQLMKGQPFFFFQRDGQNGVYYGGEEIELGYSQIFHYGCCSAFALNPVKAENMVAFFAQREGKWYYIELGFF